MNRRANRGRMGKSQKSAKPYGRATPNWIPQSGIHFSPSLSQAKDHPLINVRKILDTTAPSPFRFHHKLSAPLSLRMTEVLHCTNLALVTNSAHPLLIQRAQVDFLLQEAVR